MGKDSVKCAELVSNAMNIYNIVGYYMLYIACGTGILATKLKNMNFEVIGIDISKDMINVAKVTTAAIKFEVVDMKNFNLNKKFHIIFS